MSLARVVLLKLSTQPKPRSDISLLRRGQTSWESAGLPSPPCRLPSLLSLLRREYGGPQSHDEGFLLSPIHRGTGHRAPAQFPESLHLVSDCRRNDTVVRARTIDVAAHTVKLVAICIETDVANLTDRVLEARTRNVDRLLLAGRRSDYALGTLGQDLANAFSGRQVGRSSRQYRNRSPSEHANHHRERAQHRRHVTAQCRATALATWS